MFGTLKDGSLEINSLALKNCFSHRKIFQNGVNRLSKMVLKTRVVYQSSKFRVVRTIRFFIQISLTCGTNILKRIYGETLDFKCQH